METPDLRTVLDDLAAGRIDTAEANRRIAALQGTDRPGHDTTGAEAPADAPDTPHDPTAEGPAQASAPRDDSSKAESWAQDPRATRAATGDYLRGMWRSARATATEAASTAADMASAAADAAAARARHEEAGDRPDPAEPTGTTGQPRDGARPTPGTGRGTRGVERISVRVTGRRVRVVVDPSVSSAHVSGEHVMRRNGEVLEISADADFSLRPRIDGLKLVPPPKLDDLRIGRGKELVIRVNPALVLDVEATAGHLQVMNVPHLGRVRITAGGARIEGISQIDDALLQAAVVQLAATITAGRSRIRVESGQLGLTLEDGSNVTVLGNAQLGRVTWSGGHSGAGDEVVMGNGAARLDIGVVMGHAGVHVGSRPTRPEA